LHLSIQTESGNLSSYHLLDEESSTSFSLIVSTVCDHCKDVLSRIQVGFFIVKKRQALQDN
ncbi:hypothetical protein, partial [Geobacillus sp. LYN3]|uniref:hypothetical protein n=1 Tax=Geobacillus sp. LYN3 TaxID=2169582 RepID=UPI001E4230B9